MLVQKKENQNENNDVNNNINNDINNNINNNNINNNNLRVVEIGNNLGQLLANRNPRYIRRGFNIFLLHGLSIGELRTMRLLFHLSTYQQNSILGQQLDWSQESMLLREERWLINQLNNRMFNDHNNDNNNSINDNEQERDNEQEMINRNNNYISLNINDVENENYTLRRRYIENLLNLEFETNYLLVIGFCSGFLLNIFGILLLFCKFKPRFKIGLVCGIISSLVFYLMAVLSAR